MVQRPHSTAYNHKHEVPIAFDGSPREDRQGARGNGCEMSTNLSEKIGLTVAIFSTIGMLFKIKTQNNTIDNLKELVKFTAHDIDCDAVLLDEEPDSCQCGLSQVLKSLREVTND